MRTQLLKWIGNKQRFAHEIAGWFPQDVRTYHEAFTGSGAVLATLQPERAVASDMLGPLIGIWRMLQSDPEALIAGYAERRDAFMAVEGPERKAWYGDLRTRYNADPNALDLLFLARSCYGGVIRFSKRGDMNTPMGPHRPVDAASFAKRVAIWRPRVAHVQFEHRGYQPSLQAAQEGDLVYCDPPYTDSEATLYGAQSFRFSELVAEIAAAKSRGVRVALSIDGSKRSGAKPVHLKLLPGLFETEVFVNVGRSMLRRFQMEGQTLENEVVADRLLLTWAPPR
ncbi:MAG: Dam family site-specific DNA-(adenine-N6)-methyltransferase [Myxococcales bacterium]|nr:Dam family site-specific DNA-(adenine-N6)-methyltransferase [Myxococcales bacterium]